MQIRHNYDGNEGELLTNLHHVSYLIGLQIFMIPYRRIRSKSDRCHLVSAEFSPILQNVIRNDLSRGARRPLPSSIAARISSERDTPSGAPEPSLDVEADNLRERQLSGLAASSSQLYADMPLPRSPLQHVETCTTITLPAEVSSISLPTLWSSQSKQL